MYLFKTFTRAAGLGLCAVAFAGTALAGPGNGNGSPPVTPPGQEKKAEQPAPAPTPAPAAAPSQEKKAQAPGQQKKAGKAESKSAKAATPTKGQSANAHRHVIVCHRTGSLSNPYVVINIPYTAWLHAHSDSTGSHPDLHGNHDIMLKDPASRPGSKDGFTKAACKSSAAPVTPHVTSVTPSQQQTGTCPTTTTTERVLVGIKHYAGAVKNGQRKYVVISPNEKSAHMKAKHADDEAMYETRTVTRTVSGENCQQAVANQPTSNAMTPEQPQPIVPTASAAATAAPVGGVAGAVSPANAPAATQEQQAGGVLGTIASAPEAVAETATSGTLPFTGIPLWIAALIGGALLATGLVLRRST